jgi:hypothetical protein
MTKRETTHNITEVTFPHDNEFNGGYAVYHNDPGNCKLSYIDSVGGLANNDVNGLDKVRTKRRLDLVLAELCIAVSFNTTNKAFAEFVKENYECYAYSAVPIGYNNGYQYHFLLRNTLTNAANRQHMRALEKPKEEKPKPAPKPVPIERKPLKAKLKTYYRERGRKTDIIDEVIDMVLEAAGTKAV